MVIITIVMVIMVIRVIRVASVKSSKGILTHQGHISKFNENVHSVTQSLTHSVTLITSIASCDAKKNEGYTWPQKMMIYELKLNFD